MNLSPLDRRLAAPMFWGSVAFTACLGGLLHDHDTWGLPVAPRMCVAGMLALWPVFVAELVMHLRTGSPGWRGCLWTVAFPPLRLMTRDHNGGDCVWMPGWGWQTADRQLAERLVLRLRVPMIVISLAVLPLLAVEYYWAEALAEHASLGMAVQGAMALIWLAFVIEMMLMLSVSDNKLRYCKRHWLDLVVIALPLVSFLRAAQLARLQTVVRSARLFRLRSLTLRAWRGLLVMEAVQRVALGSAERRAIRLRTTLEEREREVAALRLEIERLEQRAATEPPQQQRRRAA